MNMTKLTIQFYWQHARRYPHMVAAILITTPIVILLQTFLTPLITASVINRLSTHAYDPHNLWASFGTDIVAFAVLQVSSGVIGWRIVDNYMWRLEGNVERDIAQDIFNHLLSQSPNFHANRFGGSLVSQTNKLMGSYIRFADTTVFQLVPLLASLIAAAVILGFKVPLYASLLIVFALIYIISAIFVTKKVRLRGAEQAAAESLQTGNLADAVTNVMAIKSFAGTDHEKKRFAAATDNTFQHILRLMSAHNGQQIYFTSFSSTILALSLFMAIFSAVQLNVNLAVVFLILSYTSSIARSLFEFSNSTLRNYNRSLGDAADMVNILQIVPEIKDPASPEIPRIRSGDIRFDNVTFTHDGADAVLFNGLTLHIKAGEKVGLVGHSGSGKTTFTRLLLRFSDVGNGSILIDGQNISHLAQDDLRRHIAYVPQEPVLFHRSLSENIGYGKPAAPQREIEAVAKLAHAHEFITLLPSGYETLVGERGVKLSGGQRQRIAIARAMLKNAPILVLDEATSSLDSESEALIQNALWKLMEGRTAIVVAHRLSTIQKMDRIVVLDGGRIVEQGTHKELLFAEGPYARLWAHQSGGFIEE